jgi:hypothetical protein
MLKSDSKEPHINGSALVRSCLDDPSKRKNLIVLMVESLIEFLISGCGAA